MSDLWGWQAGVQASQDYQMKKQESAQSKALFGLSMQEGEMKLEQEGVTLHAARLAQDRQEKLVGLMQADLAKRKSATGTVGTASETTLTDTLNDMTEYSIEAGLPEQALISLEHSTTIQKNQSEIERAKRQDGQETAQFMVDHVDSITDQHSWDAFKMTSAASGLPALDPKLAAMTYDQLKQSGFLETAKAGAGYKLQQLKIDKEKSDEKNKESEETERGLRDKLLVVQTEEAKQRLASHGKVGSDPARPDDIKAVVNKITAEYPTAKGATASDLALPIAEQVAKYRAQGLSQSEAVAKAFKESKDAGTFKNVGIKTEKNAQQFDRARTLIDELTALAQSGKRVTGAGGWVARTAETAENIVGVSGDTSAHDFESKLSELQLLIPRLLTGASRSAKDERDKVSKIARGLRLGDTAENTVSSLSDLKDSLGIDEPGTPGPRPGTVKGTILRFDAQGNQIQ